jgi:uncharacterized protein (TIGR01777 family)
VKVVLAGGTGQVGTALGRVLHAGGHEVVVLTRRAAGPGQLSWDGERLGPWARAIDGSDVVINLAGRSVSCRYSKANLTEMMRSRVRSARVVGQAIAAARRPPRAWLQMSTATIYAHTHGAPNDDVTGVIGGCEEGVPGYWAFSVDIAQAWERELGEANVPLTRKVALRAAMVMTPDKGGVFDVLSRMARLGLGGAVAGGRQYVSWIHEDDFTAAVRFIIDHDDLSGPVNLVAPGPLPQRDFMRELRAAGGGVPIGLPATRWMAELGAFAIRTDTELLLKSRRVIPARLPAAGFEFQHGSWPQAARDLARRANNRPAPRLPFVPPSPAAQLASGLELFSRNWWMRRRPASNACHGVEDGIRPEVLMRGRLLLIAATVLAATGVTAGCTATAPRVPPAALSPAALSAAAATSGPCGTATAPHAYRHVIWIWMENHSLSGIIGNKSQAPYLNSIAAKCGLAANYHVTTHPSLPNYLSATSGLAQAHLPILSFTDCSPSVICRTSARSIFGQGETWKAYLDSMPSNCAKSNSGEYAVRHNPPAYYTSLSGCATRDVPYAQLRADLAAGALPAFSFITPSLIHDMHDGTIAQGDAWLAANLPAIVTSAPYRAGTTAVFITWDEGNGGYPIEDCDDATATDASCHVPTIVISPTTPVGATSKAFFSHYSLLATTEQLLGLPRLGQAASAPLMTTAFHL